VTIQPSTRTASTAATPDGVHAAIVARIDHDNNRRLHGAIGSVRPRDRLAGRERDIWTERDRKLDEARELPRRRRGLAASPRCVLPTRHPNPTTLRSSTYPRVPFTRSHNSHEEHGEEGAAGGLDADGRAFGRGVPGGVGGGAHGDQARRLAAA